MTDIIHLEWVAPEEGELGQLFGLGVGFSWRERTDQPDDELITFEDAVFITTLYFPPTVAIRRWIH
jgi:hypothetical protein